MHYPNPLRYFDSLFARMLQRPVWIRVLTIVGITLASMWIATQGLQHGLATSVGVERQPYYEDEATNEYYRRVEAESSMSLWQEFGPLLVSLVGLIVALFAHSLVGAPHLYSRTGRFALLLQLAMAPFLFTYFSICICASISIFVFPLVGTVVALHALRFQRGPWLPPGDYAVIFLFVIYSICYAGFHVAWNEQYW